MKPVHLVCFSPTGNTRRYLEAMAEGVGDVAEMLDLTALPVPVRHFAAEDLVLVGMPVYGGRIPQVARERFAGIRGAGTRCLVAVSYGNRHYDDALLELADVAQAQGFVVLGAAALVARHTYGDIQTDRPDESDLAASRAFAVRALAREVREGSPMSIPGSRPYREGGKGGRFRPQTSASCVQCGLCVQRCPVRAIAADCRSMAETCLACFRCIRSCPKGAKHMDTEAYRAFCADFNAKLKVRRENEYYC